MKQKTDAVSFTIRGHIEVNAGDQQSLIDAAIAVESLKKAAADIGFGIEVETRYNRVTAPVPTAPEPKPEPAE